jgi:hypothetical protein
MKKLFKSDWLLLLSGDDAMASYFDEHDCQPLGQGEGPDHMMHMARLLIDSGAWNESEFSAMFSDRVPPPTSKKFLDDLKDHLVRNEDEVQCPICLKNMEEDDIVNELPCKHKFHKECILPWLQKTCSCPCCRFELPTDDKDFEEMRRQKKRAKQREQDIDTLHSSMFG